MRFVRYGPAGQERPGLVDADGVLRDLSGLVPDLAGTVLGSLGALASIDTARLPAVSGNPRLGPPVAGVGKFVCIGLNYADHAAEAGMAVPEEPVIFMKATSAIAGPNDPIRLPNRSRRTDWEVELAVVIGRPARNVPAEAALSHVAGYMVANDLSERDYQLERGGQWTKGKSCDGFGPLGPWLVTPDAVGDPQELELWLKVNGEVMQQGSTRTMIFPVAQVIATLSRYMTLQPGDVISTGTPPGVGMGRTPPRFLKPGDVVEAGIAGLGSQRQEVVDEGAPPAAARA